MQEQLKAKLGNIKKSPKTSLFGILFIVFSFYMVYEKDQTVDMMSFEGGVFLVGVMLMFADDSKVSKDKEE